MTCPKFKKRMNLCYFVSNFGIIELDGEKMENISDKFDGQDEFEEWIPIGTNVADARESWIASRKYLKVTKPGMFRMTIIPAIPPRSRHAIENLLEDLGYKVTGGGTHADMSECDISFGQQD
jgi:hypothetical protein